MTMVWKRSPKRGCCKEEAVVDEGEKGDHAKDEQPEPEEHVDFLNNLVWVNFYTLVFEPQKSWPEPEEHVHFCSATMYTLNENV